MGKLADISLHSHLTNSRLALADSHSSPFSLSRLRPLATSSSHHFTWLAAKHTAHSTHLPILSTALEQRTGRPRLDPVGALNSSLVPTREMPGCLRCSCPGLFPLLHCHLNEPQKWCLVVEAIVVTHSRLSTSAFGGYETGHGHGPRRCKVSPAPRTLLGSPVLRSDDVCPEVILEHLPHWSRSGWVLWNLSRCTIVDSHGVAIAHR